MKKYLKLSLALLVFFVYSCTYVQLDDANSNNLNIDKKHEIINDIILQFSNIKTSKAWKSYQTLEEMQHACQIPETVLNEVSTDTLFELCMRYPLYGNYMLYNDPIKGINKIINSFNGFTELKRRDDAANKVLEYYENMKISEIVGGYGDDLSLYNKNLTISHIGYIELLIAANFLPDLYAPENIDRLTSIARIKLSEKIQYPHYFSERSYKYSMILDSVIVSKKHDEKNVSLLITPQYYTYIQTIESQLIEAIIFLEASSQELEDAYNYVTETFPNALILSDQTATYNCHSYAWNMSDGGPVCWINANTRVGSNNDNIEKYWTNDYYWETPSEVYAQKIFYYLEDHSAVKSMVSGMYESKWGIGPLVRHAPGYCPYGSARKYYTHNITYGFLTCSNGNGIIEPGDCYFYYPEQEPASIVSYREWEILDGRGENAIDSGRAYIEVNGNTATISFNRPGLYEIYCSTYRHDDVQIASYFFEAVVE